jgi:uncharacterized protein (DUF1697 family)
MTGRAGQPERRMPRYIAFLRGINLGNRRLPMSRLKALFAELGFGEIETFIASGNVLFTSKVTDPGRLETRIAKHLESSLGYPVDTFLRTAGQVAAIARSKPFPEDGQEGITIHVGFWQRPVTPDFARRLAAVRTDEDEFHAKEREYYWLCRVRTSDSKVWTLPEIKALKFPTATMRNMTSIRKLAAKHLALYFAQV